jgi:hypothetical protein
LEIVLTIGSDETCDIHLAGRLIDRKHAILKATDKEVTIEDLNSQFGTFVNGQRISESRSLLPKDRLKIGTQLLDWKAYAKGFESAKADPNPIYFKDLFSYKGSISKSNYLFILLFFVVSPLPVFFGVPGILILFEGRSRGTSHIKPDHLIEPLWWLFGLLAVYIFMLQSVKRYRTHQKEKIK